MKKVRRSILLLVTILNNIVMLLMFLILLAQVIMRKFFNYPLSWPEEVSLIALVWITFIGAFQVSLHHKHLKMDLLEQHFSFKTKKLLHIVATLFVTFFLGATIYYGFPFIKTVGGTEMPITKTPMYVPYYLILISFILMFLEYTFQLFQHILQFLKGEKQSCSHS